MKVITSMPKNDIDFQNNLLLLHLELITKYLENYELDTGNIGCKFIIFIYFE